MGYIVRNCPACGEVGSHFEVFGEQRIAKSDIYVTAMSCRKCNYGWLVDLEQCISVTAQQFNGELGYLNYVIVRDYECTVATEL